MPDSRQNITDTGDRSANPTFPGQASEASTVGSDAETTRSLAASLSTQVRPTGALGQTFSRSGAGQDVAALLSGRLNLVGIELPAGITVTSITFHSKTTAAVAPTNQWFGLFDNAASPVLLRQTVDDTSTAWAANAAKTLALSSTFVTTYTGLYYLGIMIAAGTVPSLHGLNIGTTYIAQIAPVVAGTSTTGLTTPASFTSPALAPTGVILVPYAYVS